MSTELSIGDRVTYHVDKVGKRIPGKVVALHGPDGPTADPDEATHARVECGLGKEWYRHHAIGRYSHVPLDQLEPAPEPADDGPTLADEIAEDEADVATDDQEPRAATVDDIPGIPSNVVEGLRAAGYETAEQVAQASSSELQRIDGVAAKMATKLITNASGM